MSMSDAAGTAVVGAGIVGVACALHLQRMGQNVVLIDREGPAAETSFGNAGVLARAAVVPVATPGILFRAPAMLFGRDGPLFLKWSYLPKLAPWLLAYLGYSRRQQVEHIARNLAPLLRDSLDEHLLLAKGTPASRWIRPSPYLYVYKDHQAFTADSFGWNLRREHNLHWEVIDEGSLRDLEPTLSTDYRCGVVLEEHGFIASPGAYVNDLAEAFSADGGSLLRAEVKLIRSGESGVELQTEGESINAARVVVATGAWSGPLAADLGTPTPLESERGYHVELVDPSVCPSIPIFDAARKFVLTPMDTGLRVAGVVELGGLEAPATKAPIELLLRGARALLPGLEFSDRREWLGHRPSLPDSLPILGQSPVYRNVFFAYGHQHIGLTAGPKSGRLIAQLVSGSQPDVDLTAYRADRFA